MDQISLEQMILMLQVISALWDQLEALQLTKSHQSTVIPKKSVN